MVRFFSGIRQPAVVKNWIYNPSFDVSVGGWTGLSGAYLYRSGMGFAGGLGLWVSWTGEPAGPRAGIEVASSWRPATTPGTSWRLSVDLGLGGTITEPRRVYVYLQWYNGAALLSEQRIQRTITPTNGIFETYATQATAPASTTAVSLAVAMETADGPIPEGARLYFDRAMLAPGYSGGAYFDGNTPNTEECSYAWEGTAGYSYSTKATYSVAPTEQSRPLVCYERTVTAEPQAVEHLPLGARWPSVTFLGSGLESGHLTCRYGDPGEVDKLRAIAAAGPVNFQNDKNIITPIHIRKISATDDYDYAVPRINVGIDYLRIGA